MQKKKEIYKLQLAEFLLQLLPDKYIEQTQIDLISLVYYYNKRSLTRMREKWLRNDLRITSCTAAVR